MNKAANQTEMDLELKKFYAWLSNPVVVGDFFQELAEIYRHLKSSGLVHDYRIGRQPVKKLSDEITPVARFLRQHSSNTDLVQFPPVNPPDCCIWHGFSQNLRTVEVTMASAKERLFIMSELKETGIGRGFLGVSDDEPNEAFRQAIAKERTAYDTGTAQRAMMTSLKKSIRRKSTGNYAHTLLIEANTIVLPEERWIEIQPELADIASSVSFAEVHVVGCGSNGDFGLRIK